MSDFYDRPTKFVRLTIRLFVESVDSDIRLLETVVICESDIFGWRQNQVTPEDAPTPHAEVIVIREACTEPKTFRLEECELFIRCEPCSACWGTILGTQVDRMWYANTWVDAIVGFGDGPFCNDKSPCNRMPPAINERALSVQPVLRYQLRHEAQVTFRACKNLAGKPLTGTLRQGCRRACE